MSRHVPCAPLRLDGCRCTALTVAWSSSLHAAAVVMGENAYSSVLAQCARIDELLDALESEWVSEDHDVSSSSRPHVANQGENKCACSASLSELWIVRVSSGDA